jgi:hypothetical protein
MRKALILLIATASILATAAITNAHTDDGALHITANLSENATILTMGETILDATSAGYPASQVLTTPAAQGLNAYPLLNTCTIHQISSAVLLKDINLTTATSIYDLLANPGGGWTSYTNIDINLTGAVHILASEKATISLATYAAYGLTTITHFPINNGTPGRFLAFLSNNPTTTLHYQGDYAVLTALSNQTNATIRNNRGQQLWHGPLDTNCIIFLTNTYTITQDGPLCLLPLTSNAISVNLSVRDTPTTAVDLTGLLNRIHPDNYTTIIPTLTTNLNDLKNIANGMSFIASGALIAQSDNETFTIDGTPHSFHNLGFIRLQALHATTTTTNRTVNITGIGNLIFLGDHFYNPHASTSTNGISLPLELLLLWIAAAAILIYSWLTKRPKPTKTPPPWLRHTMLGVFLAMMFISFIILDRIVSAQLGVSAFDLLTTGPTSFFALLLGLQLLFWGFGCLLMAVPVILLSRFGLSTIPQTQHATGFANSIGILFVCLFAGLYFQLFLNLCWPLIAPATFGG